MSVSRPGLSLLLLGGALAAACGGPAAQRGPDDDTSAAARRVFVDVAEEAGLVHEHRKPLLDPVLSNIGPWMSSVGASAAAGDYDRDGWIDLFVTNSRRGEPNYLYRNRGDGTFVDVAAAAGLADANDESGVGMDCIWADVNNDGWLDLYVVRWGRDLLFENRGDGTFRDVTAERFRTADGSAGTPWANGNAALAFDYDLDGRIDIYVGNYFQPVDLWNLPTTLIMHDSFEVARNAGRNFLYHQEADGTFREVAADLGLDDPGWTLAAGSADVNNDGWADLYIANDFGPDQIFFNEGHGRFSNRSEKAIGQDTRKGMNVDFGDFNNDGWMDIYVTNITTAEYLQEGNMLWRNNGPDAEGLARFMDISPESGTYDGGWGWGAKFFDYDNDGDLDLFTVNGFISAGEGNYWYDLATWTVTGKNPADSRSWPTIGDRSFSGYESFRFWRNEGHESFTELGGEVGLASKRDGRGVVCFDYDNDGDVDLFIANQGQPPHLFRNDGEDGGHWLEVQLEGDPATGANADAIGARVTVVAGGNPQIRERDGGNGYSGQSDPRLHFGLGEQETVDLVEVRWPDGGVQYLENVAANRRVSVRQEPEQYAARSMLHIDAPVPRAPTERPSDRLVPQISPEELERLLGGLEEQLRRDVANHALAHEYRQRCADYDRYDRAIEFFREQAGRQPDNRWAQLELSVAYVDKIPTCGGLAAIVCKGTLAKKSLDVLDRVILDHGDWWVAYYARGMNHLHWPRALRHARPAVDDLSRSLRLDRKRGQRRDYHERLYVLLGDAHAKNKEYDAALEVWRDGLREFPGSEALGKRAALKVSAVLDYVEGQRSLERAIDTDFSFVVEP